MLQKKMFVKIIAISTVALGLAACSPKAEGVRSQIKTGQTNLDPGLTAQSIQQATVQGSNYQIKSISLPQGDDSSGYNIDVELTTPNSQALTFRTHHDQVNLDSQGIYDDSVRGFQLNVQARCTSSSCDKYLLLITVQRSNQRLFQTGAISFKSDCKFYSVSIGSNVSTLLSSLDLFNSRYPAAPMNDGSTCQ